jgi:hypothetical protein
MGRIIHGTTRTISSLSRFPTTYALHQKRSTRRLSRVSNPDVERANLWMAHAARLKSQSTSRKRRRFGSWTEATGVPAANTANLRQWLVQSEVDYFTHFVKAWIPFNAWYRVEYGDNQTERDILELVKSDGNRIRTRMIARIGASDQEGDEVRNHLAALHRRLSTDPIEDRYRRRISFENVSIGRNPKSQETLTSYGWTYSVERQTAPQRQVVAEVVDRTGNVVRRIAHAGEWDMETFEVHLQAAGLPPQKHAPLRQCYKQANPFLFRSLIAAPSDRSFLQVDAYRFVNDCPSIFAGLVDVLYGMRNLLFHGELVPDAQANQTYEPAYHLLRQLISTIA